MQVRRLTLAALKSLRRPLLAVVALALIGAQSFGLIHRVAHGTAAGWIGVSGVAAQEHSHAAIGNAGWNGTSEHSCASIDALALGNGAPVAAILLRSQAPNSHPADTRQWPNLTSPHHWPFRARAPPALFS